MVRKLAEYQPERLSQARKLRGLSVSDLAAKTNLERQSIYLFEKTINGISPGADTLVSLAKALNVSITFFTLPLRKSEREATAASAYNFRQLKSTLATSKDKAKTSLHLLAGIMDYFSEFVDVDIQLPKFDVPHFTELTEDEIEEIATRTRRLWGMGDGVIPDLTKLLESKGVIVCYMDSANGIDGVSAWIDNKPVIVLSNKTTAVRSRASLAHELGHLILHQTVTNDDLKKKEFLDVIENQAWLFAGCFLMPEKSICNEVYSTNINNLIMVKQRWLVSIAMILMRVRFIGTITEHQFNHALRRLYSEYGRKSEPLDDVIPHEEATLFENIINTLDEHKVSKKSDIYFSLGLPDDVLFQSTRLKISELSEQENPIRIKKAELRLIS